MALYSIYLEPDNKGVKQLFDYICSEFIISNRIRPSINLGAFVSDRESAVLDCFSGLCHFLVPHNLYFTQIDAFESGTVYIKCEATEKLKLNFSKTYATMSKHFDAGFDGKFLPSVWQPYITLGYFPCYDDALDMRDYLRSIFKPFLCRFSSAALVKCEPYKVIARYDLTMYIM